MLDSGLSNYGFPDNSGPEGKTWSSYIGTREAERGEATCPRPYNLEAESEFESES